MLWQSQAHSHTTDVTTKTGSRPVGRSRSVWSHQKTRLIWTQLASTDSEIFRILRLDEKLTKSVAVQLNRVVRVVTPSFWCDHSYDATRSDSTKQFCWVASFGVTTSTTRLNKTVWLSWVASFGGTAALKWAGAAAQYEARWLNR